MTRTSRYAVTTSTKASRTAAALTGTLGLAAASWVVAVQQMSGMDMGAATDPGSFAFFIAIWVPMMAAMMLALLRERPLRRPWNPDRRRAIGGPSLKKGGAGKHEPCFPALQGASGGGAGARAGAGGAQTS